MVSNSLNMIPPASPRPADLPDFEAPPVSEVVLSIQFASVPRFRSLYVGGIWDEFRDEFPNVTEQAPIDPTFETFGASARPPQSFQVFMTPPMPRFWFETKDGVELIQIQQDRMVHNWRKRELSQHYPHYEPFRNQYASEITKFDDFLVAKELGSIKPNQCEVAYINTITIPDATDPHAHLERITPLWLGQQSEPFLPRLENATVQAQYVLRKDEKAFGRVHVNFTPMLQSSDNAPMIQLTILARGKPDEESLESAFQLLDREREIIVRTFAAVTSKEMHAFWRRKDNAK